MIDFRIERITNRHAIASRRIIARQIRNFKTISYAQQRLSPRTQQRSNALNAWWYFLVQDGSYPAADLQQVCRPNMGV